MKNPLLIFLWLVVAVAMAFGAQTNSVPVSRKVVNQTNGNFEVFFDAQSNTVYTVEKSTDLETWNFAASFWNCEGETGAGCVIGEKEFYRITGVSPD